MNSSYSRYFPETVILLGAGATSNLMSSSVGIAKFFTKILCGDEKYFERNINESCYIFLDEHKKALQSLLIILGAEGNFNSETEIKNKSAFYANKYGGKADQIKIELNKLKELYNWECFKAIANSTEKYSDGNINIQTFYTQLDLLIISNSGFKTKDKFFYNHEVVSALNCALLLNNILLFCESYSKIKSTPDLVRKYESFFEAQADEMRLEAIERENIPYGSRDFILFSYAIVSFNWDPVLLGMMFHAQKTMNHSNKVPCLGEKCQKLRLFNDFGTIIGSLRKDHNDIEPYVWYQGHESIATRLNDKDYPNRIMRVGKYLWPHGSSAFRVCPVCKKTNFVVRNISNGTDYLNYYGPLILPEFNTNFSERYLLTEKEKEAFNKGIFDAIECYECGNITRMIDSQIIYQSNVKGEKPPLLQEATNEMSVLIRKAKHLIFNGYSLPPDDTIYRSMIMSAIADRDIVKDNRLKITVVNYCESLHNKAWYYRDELSMFINSDSKLSVKKEIEYFLSLFDANRSDIRFTFMGFPDIADSKEKVNNLLNYK